MEKPADFLLKPHDYLTPFIIDKWIQEAMRLGVNDAKIAKAQAHRDAIFEWQNANMQEVKVPD